MFEKTGFEPARGVEVELAVVRLGALVASVRVLLDDRELHEAAVAELPVEAVVILADADDVLDASRAAEPLEGVVAAHVGLDVLDRSSRARRRSS